MIMARIIVADDNLLIRKIYENTLQYMGHEYILCENGQIAYDEFCKDKTDLVILDMDMPVMNGLETCQKIRQLPAGISVPIIIVSAHEGEEDITRGLNAGANDYLIKPIKEAHLIAKLKSFLNVSALKDGDIHLVKKKVQLAGRYEFRRILGYGSNAVVFLAYDLQDNNNLVAIKLLKEDSEKPEIVNAFFSTAEKVQSLNHPNILKIYHYGQFQQRLYVVLEYSSYGDLATMIKPAPLGENDILKLALDMVHALSELEKNDLLHLDIKPENILIQDNQFKLADFGMVTERESATMPMNAGLWATMAYISPEYLTGDADLSIKSDIYSLGVTLYYAATGGNPFSSDKASVAMYNQLNLIPPAVSECVEDFSLSLSEVIQSMLNKNPLERPGLNELLVALSKLMPESDYSRYVIENLPSEKIFEDRVSSGNNNPRQAKVTSDNSEDTSAAPIEQVAAPKKAMPLKHVVPKPPPVKPRASSLASSSKGEERKRVKLGDSSVGVSEKREERINLKIESPSPKSSPSGNNSRKDQKIEVTVSELVKLIRDLNNEEVKAHEHIGALTCSACGEHKLKIRIECEGCGAIFDS
jgi:serine/threonine protein kinase/CheY-like chemotaxis protein